MPVMSRATDFSKLVHFIHVGVDDHVVHIVIQSPPPVVILAEELVETDRRLDS